MKVYRDLALFVLLSAPLLLTGCAKANEHEVEQTSEQTYQVSQTGSLSIRSPKSSVTIYGSDSEVIKVKAVKRAATISQLNGIDVAATVRTDSISIDTLFPPHKKVSSSAVATVDYTIILPQSMKIARLEIGDGNVLIVGMRGEDIHATLVNGELSAQNCFTNTNLSVANGGLHLLYDWWEGGNFSIYGQVTVGNARASMPRDASFHVTAQTLNGKITNDFSESVELLGHAVTKIDRLVGVGLRPEMRIRATNGDITIAGIAAD